jgi:hypothetical protein
MNCNLNVFPWKKVVWYRPQIKLQNHLKGALGVAKMKLVKPEILLQTAVIKI